MHDDTFVTPNPNHFEEEEIQAAIENLDVTQRLDPMLKVLTSRNNFHKIWHFKIQTSNFYKSWYFKNNLWRRP